MNKWLKNFISGFQHAGRGVRVGFRERNMKVHGLVTIIVVMAGIFYQLSSWEWLVIFVLIGIVWVAELVNTSIEELANVIRDSRNLDYNATKSARDLTAGAVLMAALTAFIGGLMIFGPKIFN